MRIGDVYAGRYRIDGELGRGGMGVVYAAHDTKLLRDVALKVMSRAVQHDHAAAGRFEREARALAAVQHPGIVTVHDYGQCDGELYLVMQRIEGDDLEQRLRGHRHLPPDRTAELAVGVAGALDALHRNGLVHRDVKPSNILLEAQSQRPVLCDFGLAKQVDRGDGMTGTGQTVGTVQYMSPEQLSGDPATAASDIYAFGCVLFHCLTGRPPFTGADTWEIAAGHSTRPVPDVLAFVPELPPTVQPVLERCLAKDPSARWPSAGAAAAALRGALSVASAPHHEPATARLVVPTAPVLAAVPAPVPRGRPGSRPLPRGLLVACLALVALAGAAGAVLGFTKGGPEASEPPAATSGLSGADRELAAHLSDGYGDCTPLERSPGQLAKLDCTRTPEGIASLHAISWQGRAAMDAGFDKAYGDEGRYRERACSDFRGGPEARGTGHVSTRLGVGRIACYVNANRHAVLTWQLDDRHLQLVAIRDDADSPALFAWWQSERDSVLRDRGEAASS